MFVVQRFARWLAVGVTSFSLFLRFRNIPAAAEAVDYLAVIAKIDEALKAVEE